jgi:hypothetical protein
MNIAKLLAVAMTVSTLGGAVASANTIDHVQASNKQHVGDTNVPATTATDVQSRDAAVVAGYYTRATSKPLAFANFGQWDEAASEN